MVCRRKGRPSVESASRTLKFFSNTHTHTQTKTRKLQLPPAKKEPNPSKSLSPSARPATPRAPARPRPCPRRPSPESRHTAGRQQRLPASARSAAVQKWFWWRQWSKRGRKYVYSEVENYLFLQESSLPRDHAILFHDYFICSGSVTPFPRSIQFLFGELSPRVSLCLCVLEHSSERLIPRRQDS